MAPYQAIVAKSAYFAEKKRGPLSGQKWLDRVPRGSPITPTCFLGAWPVFCRVLARFLGALAWLFGVLACFLWFWLGFGGFGCFLWLWLVLLGFGLLVGGFGLFFGVFGLFLRFWLGFGVVGLGLGAWPGFLGAWRVFWGAWHGFLGLWPGFSWALAWFWGFGLVS